MNAQTQYEIILKCIRTGAPAIADELTESYNQTVQIANEAITHREEVRKQEMEAQTKAKAEEKAKSKETK